MNLLIRFVAMIIHMVISYDKIVINISSLIENFVNEQCGGKDDAVSQWEYTVLTKVRLCVVTSAFY